MTVQNRRNTWNLYRLNISRFSETFHEQKQPIMGCNESVKKDRRRSDEFHFSKRGKRKAGNHGAGRTSIQCWGTYTGCLYYREDLEYSGWCKETEKKTEIPKDLLGRLIHYKECLRTRIVPFMIKDDMKMYYYWGLQEWRSEKDYLRDTCLAVKNRFKVYLDSFVIKYWQTWKSCFQTGTIRWTEFRFIRECLRWMLTAGRSLLPDQCICGRPARQARCK